MKYEVLTQHFGDKQYYAGDMRELDDEQAKPLIAMGLIKAQAPAKNKAEPAPKNKADD